MLVVAQFPKDRRFFLANLAPFLASLAIKGFLAFRHFARSATAKTLRFGRPQLQMLK